MTKFQKSWVILLLFVCCTFVLNITTDQRPTIWLFLVLIYSFLLFIFSMNIRWNFFLEAINKMPNEKIMLTFDDGPHRINTPKILDTLKANNIRVMFFLIGKNAAKHPDIVKRIIDEGHQVGGHSYSHDLWFGVLMGKKLSTEIMKAQHVISEIIDQPVRWFRPPFGVTNPKIAKRVKKEGLKVIGWNTRSYDSAITDPMRLKNRIGKKMTPGSIILLHDPLPQTCAVLEDVITSALKKGYEFDVLKD